MKILFIGGTGIISTAISELLLKQGHELYLVNRGTHNNVLPEGVFEIKADIHSAESEEIIKNYIQKENLIFDAVADFIAFEPSQIERDRRIFNANTKQYIFISSCSVYQKPIARYPITESTPLVNKYAVYSTNKIKCEDLLTEYYRKDGFPITIVRPSHTYSDKYLPLSIHGRKGGWQVLKRMKEGKPILIQGDGTSLWSFTHSTDFAKAFAGLIGNPHAIGEAVHITSDEITTWNQAYSIIADILGVPFNPVYVSSDFLVKAGKKSGFDFEGTLIGDKSHSVIFDNTKIKRLVPEFIASTRFDVGIERTVSYIMSHKECQTEDIDFDIFCDKICGIIQSALDLL